MVESQPSKLLVAGSIPVSRSSLRHAEAVTDAWLRLGRLSPSLLNERSLGTACLAEASKSSAQARTRKRADVAQLAERVLGKDEVTGSIPVIGSRLRLAGAIADARHLGRRARRFERSPLRRSAGGAKADAAE